MTEAQRLQTIHALIAEHTAKNTVNRATARRTLIKEGIYTEKGQLRVSFGGKRKKKAKSTA